jgi:hypothetical protein
MEWCEMKASPEYKWRICSQIIHNLTVLYYNKSNPSLALDIERNINGVGYLRFVNIAIPQMYVHECEGGSLGIADLIGVKMED